MFQSNLSIAVSSTLLIEALVSNNKILSCNFTSLDVFNFSINGICSFKEKNYREFKDRVIKILKMKNYDYFNQLKIKKNFLIKFNEPDKVFNSIKKEINKHLL